MSEEWPQEVTDSSISITMEAQPQLQEIAEAAVKRHHADQIQLNQTDMVKMASVLAEVQDQSFILGVQMGMKLIKDLIEKGK